MKFIPIDNALLFWNLDPENLNKLSSVKILEDSEKNRNLYNTHCTSGFFYKDWQKWPLEDKKSGIWWMLLFNRDTILSDDMLKKFLYEAGKIEEMAECRKLLDKMFYAHQYPSYEEFLENIYPEFCQNSLPQ